MCRDDTAAARVQRIFSPHTYKLHNTLNMQWLHENDSDSTFL